MHINKKEITTKCTFDCWKCRWIFEYFSWKTERITKL